ncbi:MAG: hypothetical protein Q9178_008064 [Gyalolechia marmorata]
MEQLSTETIWQILYDIVQRWLFPEDIPSQRLEIVEDLQSITGVCKRWREIVTFQILQAVKHWNARDFRQHYIDAASSGFTLGLVALERSSQWQQLCQPSPDYGPLTTKELALQNAVSQGRNGVVRYLIDKGVAVEPCHPPYGNTPLWLAAHSGYRSTVALLLAAGAAINSNASSEGRTALFGTLTPATIHTLTSIPSFLDSTLMLTFLLENGANLHVRDSNGHRALHHAAAYGLLREVDVLINWGAMADDQDDDDTPLMSACEGHYPRLVQDLLDREVNIDRRDSHGETALVRLCQRPVCETTFTSLRILLEHGADVNDCGSGCTPLYYALEREALALLKLLLQYGADINAVDTASRSALGIFCHDLVDDRDDCQEIMSLLLSSGANPLLAGPGIESPLHLVATYQRLQLGPKRALMQLLIQAGACIEALNFRGETVLTAVYRSDDLSGQERTAIGRFLLENGANVNGVSAVKAPIRTQRLSSDMLKLLFEFDADLDTVDEQGNTVLDLAIRRGDTDLVALLRREGAWVGRKLFGEVRIP